jgi:hypothetical protein
MTLHHYREEHGLDESPLIEITDPIEELPDESVESKDESEATEVKHGN